MRSAGGSKRLLNADVKLGTAGLKPDSAPSSQRLRLGDLPKAEYPAVEPARRRLAALRSRQLYMVDAAHAAGWRRGRGLLTHRAPRKRFATAAGAPRLTGRSYRRHR